MKNSSLAVVLLSLFALAAVHAPAPSSSAVNPSPSPGGDSSITVGGEPVVFLNRPQPLSRNQPQFLQATILPGNGMNLLQLRAYIPGQGDVDLLNSPALSDAKRLLAYGNDEFGNQSFMVGGAILLPYPNRIRGTLSPDGKTIETDVEGKIVSLPANWRGKLRGAKFVAMHGLILSSQFQDVNRRDSASESEVTALLHAGDFGGHWLSQTDVAVKMILRDRQLEMTVTARNVGHAPLPMAIGFHPYFRFPSGDRRQARLRLPAISYAIVNNYDDVFPRGQIVSVKNSAYDFTPPGGVALNGIFLDDCFTDLARQSDGSAVIEITDPAARYGMRIRALSPQIKSIQVYAPPAKNFVVVEPQFNLADPFDRKVWGDRDTGVVTLAPGESVSWRILLELFTPSGDLPETTQLGPE
ncbi:MAG TPA: aldose 1-epimerase [Verrucomicrobiae bacterium]|nr:aldose 1-epimerase [Verrucomicrobiae bacterium]